jgi:hypothetical protein
MVPSPIKHEPAAALPDPDLNPGWYGEFMLQYPRNQTIIPVRYPQWTRFKYQLLRILRPVASELFDNGAKGDFFQRRQLYMHIFQLEKCICGTTSRPIPHAHCPAASHGNTVSAQEQLIR